MMAGSDTVYTVTVNRGWISVDVDRYTFTFAHHRPADGSVKLTVCRSVVHGKHDSRVRADDQVARQARREAERLAGVAVAHWLREHPSAGLTDLHDEIIWLHPSYPRLTADERAMNQAAAAGLIAGLADGLAMP